MVQSVLDVMPDVQIVQMTDRVTPEVSGVSAVSRRDYDGKLMTFRMQHLADLEDQFITLDTDVVVQKELLSVFEQPFDVALTKRTESIKSLNGVDLAKEMPYNTGVMFSKNRRFWQDALKVLMQLNPETHTWWGDQLSVKVVAESGRYGVRELSCDQYNYTPKNQGDRPDVHVIHYKGERKQWMIRNAAQIRPNV